MYLVAFCSFSLLLLHSWLTGGFLLFLRSAHTQAMAYLTGAIAGDKIVEEYGWDNGIA